MTALTADTFDSVPDRAALPQAVTPQLLAWVREQGAGLGAQPVARADTFAALVDTGWHPLTASRALRLTLAERLALLGDERGLHLPSPLIDSAGMVNAGDKWVQVLQHQQAPEVIELAQLLSGAECDALMAEARPRLSRSLTVDLQTGGEALHADRTSQGMFFARGESALVQRLDARIARLLNWPAANGEGLQVLCYPPGAQYRPHYDYFDPAEPGTPALLARGGQRVGTLIIYLQAPESGGATVFPDLGLQVAPVRGNAVFFSYPQPHPASGTLHGGEPVLAGRKWIATKWLRAGAFS